MISLNIVADESVDYSIVTELRKKEYSVYAICEHHPSLSDREVLSIAFDLDALLITEDKDILESLCTDSDWLIKEFSL